ncbi:unnamed protein product [Vitrella brassicaformis CCMP3155]|uniref:TauD/TfdA-like domain-containing protein n=1 Tax=Vitrella brassicaformis (strain CCMP3155) TaxID=1169540 RepID=A0A0G4EX95_VITBC|nr:unnamed protein product [Vitrella brassicaformis CCMP3155]|eukprot:CEM02715.1 unnamed protein product [Vitrella brassicaformis CCMP3155]
MLRAASSRAPLSYACRAAKIHQCAPARNHVSASSSTRLRLLPSGCRLVENGVRGNFKGWNTRRRFATIASPITIHDVSRDSIEVVLPSGARPRLSSEWLRDHCQCSGCIDYSTYQRKDQAEAWMAASGAPAIASATIASQHASLPVSDESGVLVVEWADGNVHGHVGPSVYGLTWLQRVLQPTRDTASDVYTRRVWTSESMTSSLPEATFAYTEVVTSNERLLQCLESIRDFGFALVESTPLTDEATHVLCSRIAFFRRTVYADGLWKVEVKPMQSASGSADEGDYSTADTAYSSLPLHAHTDCTYFEDPPGLQVFHCHASDPAGGGQSLLVDGYRVAHDLRANAPHTYEYWRRTPVAFHFTDASNQYIQHKPVIQTLAQDESVVAAFRFNKYDRAPVAMSPDEAAVFYRHLKVLLSAIRAPAGELWLSLTPGTTLIFNNHRVLHGRSGFSVRSPRKFSGGYISMEDYHNRIRVLCSQRKSGVTSD